MENTTNDLFGFWAATTLIADTIACTNNDFMADWMPATDTVAAPVIKNITRSAAFVAEWN